MSKSIYSLTAKELAPDILILLLLYRKSALHEAVLRQVLKGACWWVANAQGRGDSCDRWSKAALKARNSSTQWAGLGLIHEHMVPRNVIEEAIVGLREPTEKAIEELLALSQVCVVTPDEDGRLRDAGLGSKLPTSGLGVADIMSRYGEVGIELADEAFRPREA